MKYFIIITVCTICVTFYSIGSMNAKLDMQAHDAALIQRAETAEQRQAELEAEIEEEDHA